MAATASAGTLDHQPAASRAGLARVAFLAVLLWAWASVPLLTGSRTLYFRDVFLTHLPLKAYGAAALAAGRVPAFNESWGLGQPFRGNPNAAAFYPGNLLYLALPFWPAFNAHYALHWLLAALTMGWLARRLGQSRAAALLAAVTYGGCGFTLSAMSFYNLLTVVAWWPLVLAGAVRGGGAGLAAGGLACGLALLGGEPVTAVLGLVPLLAVAIDRHGLRRGAALSVGIGLGGLAVALPQLVETLRVAPFTMRGGGGLVASQIAHFSLRPLRLLELALPFPFGLPGWHGARGVWAVEALPHTPFFYALYPGLVAAVLALAVPRGRRRWLLLAAASCLLAWLGGAAGGWLARLGGGLVRSPEKLLFWLALTLPLLAGWGLDACRAAGGGRPARLARAGGVAMLALGVALAAARSPLVDALAGGDPAAIALGRAQLGAWAAMLAWGGGALGLAGWALGAGRPALAVAAQVLALAQLAPLVFTDRVDPYRRPADWTAAVGPRAAVLPLELTYPPWPLERPAPRFADGPPHPAARRRAADLGYAPGVLHGLRYPLAPDVDGMIHLFSSVLLTNLANADWPARVAWARRLGVEAVTSPQPLWIAGLTPRDRRLRSGVPSFLYRLERPAPAAWWPRRVTPVATPRAAFAAGARALDVTAEASVPRPLHHRAGARLEDLRHDGDRIAVTVAGGGGLLVIRQSYQPLWRASSGEQALAVLPVDLCLLGVEVPAGRHRVVLTVDHRPAWLAAAGAGGATLVLLGVWLGARRRRSRAS